MRAARQTVLVHLSRFLDEHRLAELPDADLLERFVTHRDDASFAALVRRHGPTVLGLCRRRLGQQQDADDAFQATFLVLARRAGSLRKRHSVGAWLHGVAYRVSCKARVAADRRRRHEQRAGLARPDSGADVGVRPEAFALLDEELARLPERFRGPLVLCYLDGATREEAARRLSLTPRNLKARLERGRAMLRRALERRGVSESALAGLLVPPAGAALPGVLAGSAVRHAALFALRSGRGEIPTSVLTLAEGVLAKTLLSQVHVVLLVALALGGLVLGVGVASSPPRVEVRKAAPPVSPVEETRPIVDRHGDPLPEGALARLGTVRFRHGAEIVAMSLSRDGNVLATGGGGFDGRVLLWDMRTGKVIREFTHHKYLIFAVALSPDGGLLAYTTSHSGLFVFDVKTGKDMTPSPKPAVHRGRPTSYTSLAFSPDGKLLAGVTAEVLPHLSTHVWKVSTNERLHTFPTESSVGQQRVVSFSADGKSVGTGGNEPAVWDLTTGQRRVRFGGVKGPTSCAALSPDGKTMAVGYEDRDGLLQLWDTTTGKVRGVLKGPVRMGAMSALTFTGDGETLFSAGKHDPSIHQWDVRSGKEVRAIPIDSTTGQNVAVSADGKTLVAAGGNHTARVWKAKPGPIWEEFTFTEAHESSVMNLAFSPDGETLASTSWHGPARLWDVRTRKQIGSQIGGIGIYALAFAPDGKSLVFSCKDSIVRWCDPRTGAVKRSLPWKQPSYPAAIGFLDGKTLVAGYSQKSVHLMEMGQVGKPRPLKGDEHTVSQIRFSPDGRTLITSSHDDKTILLRDAATGRQTRKIEGVRAGWTLTVSADGKLMAAGGENSLVHLWDLDARKERAPLRGHTHHIESLAFSCDGRWLATSCGDHVIRLYETASGTQAGLFRGHLSPAKGLAFSPDGRILASGSDDTSILLWDVADRFVKDRPARLTRQHLDALWVDLADDAGKARRAIHALARSPRESVPFLRERTVGKKVDPMRLDRLIVDLDDDAFEVRQRATKELQSFGEAAGPAMRKAVETTASAEVKVRLRRALDLLDRITGEQRRLRDLRVRAALEYAGTAEARRLLEALPRN